jgi:hypothetical protein
MIDLPLALVERTSPVICTYCVFSCLSRFASGDAPEYRARDKTGAAWISAIKNATNYLARSK